MNKLKQATNHFKTNLQQLSDSNLLKTASINKECELFFYLK